MRRFSACVTAAAVTAMVSPLAPALAGRRVDMVLTTSLSENFEPARGFRKYMVLQGDNLYRIFRKFGLPDGLMPEYLARFLEKNPRVTNPDLLIPGQVIFIPEAPAASDAATPPLSPSPSPLPSLPAQAKIAAPRAVADRGLATADIIRGAFTQLGEKVRDKGTLFIPIGDSGTLSLDNSRFPLLSLGGGSVFILDPEGQTPEAVKELIETAWPRYRVVRLKTGADAEDILDRVLRQSGYHAVDRDKKLVLGKDAKISLNVDWLVEKSPDSILTGQLYALNYARFDREIIPPSIRDFVGRYNITVINVPGGSEVEASRPAPAPKKLSRDSLQALVDDLLACLGIPFSADVGIKLYGDGGEGMSLSFNAHRLINTAGGKTVICSGTIAAAMEKLLVQSGYAVVALVPGRGIRDIITDILAAFGIRYFGPLLEFYQPGQMGERKFVVTLNGIFIRHNGENLLFTDREPDEALLSYLAGKEIKVIIY